MKQKVAVAYSKFPFVFEPNRGQTDTSVKFLSRGPGYTLFLSATEAVLALRTPRQAQEEQSQDAVAAPESRIEQTPTATVLRMKLVGANPRASVTGADELSGRTNYFIGSDPTKWRTNVPHFAKVRYQDVYPGIDLVYYGNQEGRLEHDFIVSPGADPNAIRLAFEGVKNFELDAAGGLVLRLAAGEVRFEKPSIYQDVDSERQEIAGNFVLRGKNEVGFEVRAYDTSNPLIIDPVLVYSTYLGSSSNDSGNSIAVDGSGNVYVAGHTSGAGFPTASPFQAAFGGAHDAFVTKFNPAGSALIYSTYLGGNGVDQGFSIAVDASGNAYVTGRTDSTNFPTTMGAFQTADPPGRDAFVTKLNASGSALVYSTYLGGNGSEDQAWGIALDASGNTYITGQTNSSDWPTASPVQAAFGGFFDAFVTKLNATGSALVYSTYLGGSDLETGEDIAVDAGGSAYVTGQTRSTNFPTANPFQPAFAAGVSDAFVTKLNNAGSGLVYSTYLGGSDLDVGGSIAVDASGQAYVMGGTCSTNFPTSLGAFQTTYGGGANCILIGGTLGDAFVTKLNAAGSALMYSTYLGGSGDDGNSGALGIGSDREIVADSAGNVYVTGFTNSTDFPTANPIQSANAGGFDSFVSKLNAAGAALIFSTYLGGSGLDIGSGIAVDGSGNAYVTGVTGSTDFPTASPFQAASAGGQDAFVAKLAEPPADLALAKRADKTEVESGENLTYGIGVINFGPNTATGVVVTDQLPSGTSFVSATPTQGTCTFAGGTVTCNLGNLEKFTFANPKAAAVKIVVQVTAPEGSVITNTATVSADNPDPRLANNSTTVTTKVGD